MKMPALHGAFSVKIPCQLILNIDTAGPAKASSYVPYVVASQFKHNKITLIKNIC